MTDPETETGLAVDTLIAAVRNDMGKATEGLAAVSALFAEVARRGRGINGLAVSCNGWRALLDGMQEEIGKEVADVERKYRGEGGPEIHERVDKEHAAAVVEAAKVIAARAAEENP